MQHMFSISSNCSSCSVIWIPSCITSKGAQITSILIVNSKKLLPGLESWKKRTLRTPRKSWPDKTKCGFPSGQHWKGTNQRAEVKGKVGRAEQLMRRWRQNGMQRTLLRKGTYSWSRSRMMKKRPRKERMSVNEEDGCQVPGRIWELCPTISLHEYLFKIKSFTKIFTTRCLPHFCLPNVNPHCPMPSSLPLMLLSILLSLIL